MDIKTYFHGYSKDFGTMDNGSKWSGFRVFLTDVGAKGAKSYISKMPDTPENFKILDDIAVTVPVHVDYDRIGRITRIYPVQG